MGFNVYVFYIYRHYIDIILDFTQSSHDFEIKSTCTCITFLFNDFIVVEIDDNSYDKLNWLIENLLNLFIRK